MAKRNTDTVKAILTPGEFVIKKKSAKKIGYDKLNQMNKTGNVNNKETKMPQGIGTYASKVGRPSKKAKGYKDGGKAKKMQIGGRVPDVRNPEVSPLGRRGPATMPGALPRMRPLEVGPVRGYSKGGKVSGGYAVHGESDKYKAGK